MKILKLYEHKKNTGGIVSFQHDMEKFYTLSDNRYFYFRTGKIHNHLLLSNSVFRWFDLAYSYIHYPLLLLFLRPDLIEINSSMMKKSFYRDMIYLRLSKVFSKKSKVLLFNHGWNIEFKEQMLLKNPELFLRFYKGFDKIILLANSFKTEMMNFGISENAIDVVTTGIDINLYQHSQPDVVSSKRILFLSRIEKEKGIYEFLEAIPYLIGLDMDLQFDIAGSGDELERVINHEITLKYKENIHFHGYIMGEDKIKLFEKAMIYVFPSYSEGCPVSVLEAMASGLPIIYTEVGALKELMTKGKNGIVILPNDSSNLVNALTLLLEKTELRRSIGINNKKKAISEFNIKDIFHKIEHIYANA